MKALLFLFLLSSIVLSKTYEFSESRYSDAFDSEITRDGIIDFGDNSISIKYDNSDKEIIYDSSILILKENNKPFLLSVMQEQRLVSFLEILLLVYDNDKINLADKFDIQRNASQIILKPKDDIKKFIEKIILEKSNRFLKTFKLVLENDDIITISIGNEVH